jgi:DNA adenine methylase
MGKSIIPWMGGKRRLAKHILPHLEGTRTYVEPFCGGASMFFMKEPSKVEVINDINGELVNLYRVVKFHLDELVRHFRWALVSREEFLTQRAMDPATLTDVQRAARFYYLMKAGFGGRVTNPSFGTAKTAPVKLNILRLEHDLSDAHIRLARTTIENRAWDQCIKQYDSDQTVFYLDPPYWQTAGYGQEFGFDHYEKMAALMAEAEGRIVLSINDHPDIRKVFNGFEMQQLDITYTLDKYNKTKASELLITNR